MDLIISGIPPTGDSGVTDITAAPESSSVSHAETQYNTTHPKSNSNHSGVVVSLADARAVRKKAEDAAVNARIIALSDHLR